MEHSNAPQILALPFPAEGHIKPMFNLTKLLSEKGHKITFVNTHHNHNRLLQFTDIPSFHTQFPDFHFASITDGIPEDHPRDALVNYLSLIVSSRARSLVAKEFKELFLRLVQKYGQWLQPPSCIIIADGLMSTIAMGVVQELQVPLITFRTYSATCTWVTIHMSKLSQEGVLLRNNQENMKSVSANIPGLENLLRNCDLPFYSTILLTDESINRDFIAEETLAMTQASALILNTFEQLEPSIITKLATIFPKVYSIGPLHTLLKTNNSSSPHKLDHGLRKEDRSCITWLDHQKEKSVLYVSFGTVVELSHEQLLEFWHGLVNSLKPFLWVMQKDSIQKTIIVPIELEMGTKERGFLVNWAPQEEVLAHPSVGGFLTHSGWNSTLECIAEGVPMLCWPWIGDQMVNSRCVSGQWKIGLDMKNIGTCDRFIVEKMVRDILENQMKELTRSAEEIAKKAHDSTKENGSSYYNLENLIKDIRLMMVTKTS